jgi:probable F420-dependent oxidoreductase
VKFVIPTAFSEPATYCELARICEDHGYDTVAVSDHVVHPASIRTPYPYTEDGAIRWNESTPWPDPWVAIGAMATVTRRLRFMTNIYVLPMRNPFLAAKAIATAAVLSGDRVTLGVGVGWMKDEFELLQQDFHTRGRRTDEMIEVLRKLWSGEQVEHRGRFYAFEPLRMLPAPAQRIPILVGGLSEPALRRAARLGDGWISDLHRAEELCEIVARLRRYRAEAGRAHEPLDVVASCLDAFDADGIRRLAEAGVTHYATAPWVLYGGGYTIEDQRDGLRRFADEVIAKLR